MPCPFMFVSSFIMVCLSSCTHFTSLCRSNIRGILYLRQSWTSTIPFTQNLHAVLLLSEIASRHHHNFSTSFSHISRRGHKALKHSIFLTVQVLRHVSKFSPDYTCCSCTSDTVCNMRSGLSVCWKGTPSLSLISLRYLSYVCVLGKARPLSNQIKPRICYLSSEW